MPTFSGESDYSFINFIDLRDLTLGFSDFSHFLFIESLNVITFFCLLLSVSFWLLKMEIEVTDLKPLIFTGLKHLMSELVHNRAQVGSQDSGMLISFSFPARCFLISSSTSTLAVDYFKVFYFFCEGLGIFQRSFC